MRLIHGLKTFIQNHTANNYPMLDFRWGNVRILVAKDIQES